MGTPSCETLAGNAVSCRHNLAGPSDPRSCGILLPAPKRLQKEPDPGHMAQQDAFNAKTRRRGGQARAGPAASTGCAVFAKAGFLCDNRRHPFGDINRPVGAAGAQVPYKHKVTGSNPVPATIKIAGQTLFSSDLFFFREISGKQAPDKLAAIGHASLPSICRTHKNVR